MLTACVDDNNLFIIQYLYSERHCLANDLWFVPVPEHLAVLKSEILPGDELDDGLFRRRAMSHETSVVHIQ